MMYAIYSSIYISEEQEVNDAHVAKLTTGEGE